MSSRRKALGGGRRGDGCAALDSGGWRALGRVGGGGLSDAMGKLVAAPN
jgi:hypothetical protein